MNTFGEIYRLTTFGESHNTALGGVIDGLPAGIAIDHVMLQKAMERRRPGQSSITTMRDETDKVEILSGVFNGLTLGTPIGFTIANRDHHSSDYAEMEHAFRPSHADYTYTAKYGLRDHRGGGRASARETACRVVGGELARQALATLGIRIYAYTSAVGHIVMPYGHEEIDPSAIDSNAVRCPDTEYADRMIKLINQIKSEGDTIGGSVTCVIKGCPAGLGDPVFSKLQARLSAAMMSINAAKSFEYGMGTEGCRHRGSEMNDIFTTDSDGRVHTITNHSGGIQGGISNGEDIYFTVAFKPVATLLQPVRTIDDKGNEITLQPRGRHDPCVVARAVPVVEAMAAMTILDAYLLQKTAHLI